MSKHIKVSLSQRSIKRAMRELKEYRAELIYKCQVFCERLAEMGIVAAESHSGMYGDRILFRYECDPEKYGAKAVLIAENRDIIKSQWMLADGSVKEADVSPLLMMEFGAGLPAQENPRGPEFGMGTGAFPSDTAKEHAENPEGWWYMDLEGNWHHSVGITPSMPVGNAASWMRAMVRSTAKEVFGS